MCRRRAARLVLRCARVAGPVGAVGIDVERPRGALDDLFRDHDFLDAFQAHPKIDPIDWIERIPFSETRNYVQRVLENLQVYRVRFGGGSKLLIEADLRRGAKSN